MHLLGAGLFVWQIHDPAVKADLFSTAILTPAGIYVIDPTPISKDMIGSATAAPVTGVIVTNANHARAAVAVAETFDVPIYARREAVAELDTNHVRQLGADRAPDGLQIIEIEGAAPGEIVLYRGDSGGTVVFGDAVINAGSYGFTLLPAKYCSSAKQMRVSLRQLLAFQFERMLFAHGMPILSQAHRRFSELLDGRS